MLLCPQAQAGRQAGAAGPQEEDLSKLGVEEINRQLEQIRKAEALQISVTQVCTACPPRVQCTCSTGAAARPGTAHACSMPRARAHQCCMQ